MRKGMVLRVTLLLALLVGSASAVEIAVVNMEQLIEVHPRTRQDREILESYIADFEQERDERLRELQEKSEAFERLREEAEDIGLTDDAIRERRQRAQLKLQELQRGEAALREMASQRQQELTRQEMRMRERIMREIKDVLHAFAEEHDLDMILDGGEDPAGGYGAVLFAREPFEVTEQVAEKLRQTTPEEELDQ